MLVFCSYKYNSTSQCLEKPTSSLVPQILIPFNNRTKRGWCDYHKRWELVTISPEKKMFFSCGFPVPGNIGLNGNWNKNQYEFFVDTENFVIRVNERWSWIDVFENQIYETEKLCSKIIDFNQGIISHPINFDIEELPPTVNQKLMDIILKLFKKIYGIDLHIENVPFTNFVKYPFCPEFREIESRVDDVKRFNFRGDSNLFKDFCRLVQIKETKQLRKNFHKNPKSILLHAMAQYLGFTNSDAIKTFVSNEDIYNTFVESNLLRFSIMRRTIYISGNGLVLNGLRLWVQNARTDKSESVVAKRLVKFFKNANINVVFDAIDIYYQNARNLPVAFHERILKEGFTLQMHDQLVQYFGHDDFDGYGYSSNEKKVENREIKYDDDVFRFEDFIEGISTHKIKKDYESVKQNRLMMLKAQRKQTDNLNYYNAEETIVSDEVENEEIMADYKMEDLFDYEKVENELAPIETGFELGKDIMKKGNQDSYFFALPRDTDELYEISTHMRNCVGYLYRTKAVSKESIIAVLIKDRKMRACFEIKQNPKTYRYEIVQASGPGNSTINRIYMYAIEEWKKRHDLSGDVFYKL